MMRTKVFVLTLKQTLSLEALPKMVLRISRLSARREPPLSTQKCFLVFYLIESGVYTLFGKYPLLQGRETQKHLVLKNKVDPFQEVSKHLTKG